MATHLIVTYISGEVETIPLRPRAVVEAERKYGGQVAREHGNEGTFYAAWFIKGRPGNFDDWLDTIEDADEKAVAVRPLEPAPSPEESLT